MTIAARFLGAALTLIAPVAHAQTTPPPSTGTAAPFACQPPPTPIVEVEAINMYADRAGTKVDKDKAAASIAQQKPLRDYLDAVGAMTDQAVTSKSATAQKECALVWLDAWAKAGGLTKTGNDGSVVRTIAAASLSMSVVKLLGTPGNAKVCDLRERRVGQWLRTLAQSIAAHESKGRPPGKENNVTYWAALAAFNAGLASGDAQLKNWGIGVYNRAMDHVTPQGFLPRELERGEQALKYHWFALSPLVTLRLMANSHGAAGMAGRDEKLHRLARAAIDGLTNTDAIEAAAKVKIHKDDVQKYPISQAFLAEYACAFPGKTGSVEIAPSLQADWRLGTSFPYKQCDRREVFPMPVKSCGQ